MLSTNSEGFTVTAESSVSSRTCLINHTPACLSVRMFPRAKKKNKNTDNLKPAVIYLKMSDQFSLKLVLQ